MKPGCFIKLIIVLTIVTAAVVWIVQNKFDEFIADPGRKVLAGFFFDEMEERFAKLKPSSEKDSLKSLFSNFIENEVPKMNTFSDKMFDHLGDSLKKYEKDSVINKQELEELVKLFRNIRDEGSKKN